MPLTPLLLLLSVQSWSSVKVVALPDARQTNPYYVGNRAPLNPSPFIRLPVGAITPNGWLRRQLQLEADGFFGHLTEISAFLKKPNNAWLSPTGEGDNGWEEVPYWLKGFGDLGYVLGDQRVIKEAKTWLNASIASQRADGYFGPKANATKDAGKPDVWPNMLMLFALQSYYEYAKDPRVIDLMARYFKWELAVPEKDFLVPDWQKSRGGDNLASVYWLYNRTGDKSLLDLAAKIHRNTEDWTTGVHDWHGVNFGQGFREPETYFVQSKDPADKLASENDYAEMKTKYGQVPGGMYGADENARPGFGDPRQAAETCAMVEMMQSDEMLLAVDGEPKWADRCEDVAFNSLPASMTPDLKALHYLTSPNLILADKGSKSPGLQNGGPMLLFDPNDHRCCQHNVGMGWPYFAEHLWMATPDHGLASVLYAPCDVKARAGNGGWVKVHQDTKYPFGETIRLSIEAEKPNTFPIYLRVPGWCPAPFVTVDGKAYPLSSANGRYVAIKRQWSTGDTVILKLPMPVTMKTWAANKGAVSVNRGPLTYALKIGEGYLRAGGTENWPAWEVRPTTAWNYGLIPGEKFQVVKTPWDGKGQPFDLRIVPIEIKAKARKIPGWQADYLGLVGKLQQSPARSTEPVETITLIPMGAARLRISAFPTVTDGPGGHDWLGPKPPVPATASWCFQNDTVNALSDGLIPISSNDETIPRFTWWNHKGTPEWVRYDFPAARKVSECGVYWFDDRGKGECRIPAAWRVKWFDGVYWHPVKGATYGVGRDRFNVARFEKVTAKALRIDAQLRTGFSAGILEWQVR